MQIIHLSYGGLLFYKIKYGVIKSLLFDQFNLNYTFHT